MRPNRSSIIFSKVILAVVICIFVSFCSKSDNFKLDFSSPEKTVQTFFNANKRKMPDVFIESLSLNSRKLFGEDYKQQVDRLRSDLGRSRLSGSSDIEIVNVEYINESNAEVVFNQLSKEKIFIPNSKVSVTKENNQWKIILPKEPPPTPEQIAQAQRAKEIMKTDFVLDEEKNAWVPVDKK